MLCTTVWTSTSAKPASINRPLKLIRVHEGMLAALDPGCSLPKDTIKRQYKGVRTWRPLDRTVDAKGDATRRRQHPAHFAEGAPLIWKELQAQLAKNQVNFSCRERQIERTAIDPIDRRPLARKRPGNCQHPFIQVQAGDVPLGYPPACQAGNNAGSASDVENLFSRLGAALDRQDPPPILSIAGTKYLW